MTNRSFLSLIAAAATFAASFQVETAQAAGTGSNTAVAYTNVASVNSTAPVEIIPVRIDTQFNVEERAKILEALRHWNHALNGQIRFDVSATPYNVSGPVASAPTTKNAWIIARVSGTGAMPAGVLQNRGPQLGMTLAQTQQLLGEGGMVLVFADKIGNRDLGGIMLHELGHVLGLGHDNAGRLMAPTYSASAQQCIDRGAVQAVAQIKGLAFENLNWCADTATIAAAARNQGQVASR